MHWVWRAEHGGFKAEYAAVIFLVAALVGAIFAFGLPTDVQRLYETGLCRITGEDDCENPPAADSEAPTEDVTPSPDTSTDPTPSPEDPSASPGEDPEVMDPVGAFDEDAADAYADAKQDLEDAQADLDNAEEFEVYDELMDLVGDLIGYNDAKACLTEGDLMACLWTVVGLSPFGKGAKLVKNTPKIVKLWNRYRKAKKARGKLESAVDSARGKLDTAASKCELLANGGGTNNRVHPAPAGYFPGASDAHVDPGSLTVDATADVETVSFVPEKPKKRKTPCELNWNPTSKPTFGHTFNDHGKKKTATRMTDRARSMNKPQGHWQISDQEVSDLIKKSYDPNKPGPQVFEAPSSGVGNVIYPDGTSKKATHFLVVLKEDGTFKTGYPYIP
ncbi:hypothetical protein GCM10027440_08420 [Nocardiopsis coralliicola]